MGSKKHLEVLRDAGLVASVYHSWAGDIIFVEHPLLEEDPLEKALEELCSDDGWAFGGKE